MEQSWLVFVPVCTQGSLCFFLPADLGQHVG